MMAINRAIKLFLLYVLAFVSAKGQSQTRLKIGDSVPDYRVSNVLNYGSADLNLSAFKGKILILDFWTYGCLACVNSWPKLLELQDRCKDLLQIVLVNPDNNQTRIQKFVSRQERISGYKMTLPIVWGDSVLASMFPHQLVPHVVFVDTGGRVKYIANGIYLNQNTIDGMLEHKKLNIPLKTDEYASVDWHRPLFIDGNIPGNDGGAEVMWSTVITPFSPEQWALSSLGRYQGRSYGYISNYPIRSMFGILYGKGTDARLAVRNSRLILKDLDSARLVSKVNGKTITDNWYTFQVTSKKDLSIPELKQRMIAELEHYFDLKTGWEKQRMPCLVISRSDTPLTQYIGGEESLRMGKSLIDVNNITMEQFVDVLGFYIPTFAHMSYPIVDETGYQGKLGRIFIERTDDVLDYRILGKLLPKHGLRFSVEERDVDVVVIRPAK